MRTELFNAVKERLSLLCVNAAGEYYMASADMVSDLHTPVIAHIDLWNHNVEFLEEEAAWPRPAVFIEICPIKWKAIVPGVEYRAEPLLKLHIVTDWADAASDESYGAISMLDIPEHIHDALAGLEGHSFMELSLAESDTNHNHEDIVENIEVYEYVAIKSVGF